MEGNIVSISVRNEICIWKITWELVKCASCMIRKQLSHGGMIRDFIDLLPLRTYCQIYTYDLLFVYRRLFFLQVFLFFVAYIYTENQTLQSLSD